MKTGKAQKLDDMLKEFDIKRRLDSLNSLVEQVQLPADVYPALQTGRTELLKIMAPRPMSAEECAAVYKLLAVMIETNQALIDHGQQLAQLVSNWGAAFVQLNTIGNQIEQFARFEPIAQIETE